MSQPLEGMLISNANDLTLLVGVEDIFWTPGDIGLEKRLKRFVIPKGVFAPSQLGSFKVWVASHHRSDHTPRYDTVRTRAFL
jgi:hypothetical protein